MATKIPLILVSGEIQQLQAGDLLDYVPTPTTQSVGDTNATITNGVSVVQMTTVLTTPRILTLPAASLYGPGKTIIIYDPVGVATIASTLSVIRAGSDTVNGLTSAVAVMLGSYESVVLFSDGVSSWSTGQIDGNLVQGFITGSSRVVKSNTPTITTPDFTGGFKIQAAALAGKFPQANGGTYFTSAYTLPTTAGTSGKILVSNGTNIVSSTPTFPNASATANKIIKSDGTDWVASTETYAAPGTSGNVLTSDGTNWTSAAPEPSVPRSISSDYTVPADRSLTVAGSTFTVNVGVALTLAAGAVLKIL